MRGTPSHHVDDALDHRIIPAYAGNTDDRESKPLSPRDHPRVCGEHLIGCRSFLVGPGSSPRMRGTRSLRWFPFRSSGIIPAYAGNTYPPSVSCVTHWDHPRVCGEHTHSEATSRKMRRSSPRMRGTHEAARTYAREREYHPRVCGEHSPFDSCVGERRVSSPRMRGTHLFTLPAGLEAAIIPAYAGNTLVIR